MNDRPIMKIRFESGKALAWHVRGPRLDAWYRRKEEKEGQEGMGEGRKETACQGIKGNIKRQTWINFLSICRA